MSIKHLDLFEKTKKLIKGFEQTISDYADICEAFNQVASCSSTRFARSFDYTAKRIAAARRESNKETYLSLSKKACQMLSSGQDEVDVIRYFDNLLLKEMRNTTEKEK